MARVVTPPTMAELLRDPTFAAYMEHPPHSRHPGLLMPGAWRLWAVTTAGGWKTKLYDDYPQRELNTLLGDSRVRDVAVTSRRVFFSPPGEWEEYKVKVTTPTGPRIELRERWVPTFRWDRGLSWCARCRRPSLFMNWSPDHHALRLQPALTDDAPARCYYCGIRYAGLPRDPYSLED